MKRITLFYSMLCLLLIMIPQPAMAKYSVERAGDVVKLIDSVAGTSVSVLPSTGNRGFEMLVNGVNVLHFPYNSIDEFKQKPGLSGIPLLAPWANRLDEQAFYANGKKYIFNMELGNVRGPVPMHGFLANAADWKVVEARADKQAAWITCRLEFWRQPSYMAQWPFAHNIVMTYRLREGELEVRTRIENLSAEPMPVTLGFHPYFRITDAPRDEWTISIGARSEWLLSPNRMPTGETQPIEKSFADPKSIPLKGLSLDNVYGDLVRDSAGRAVMSVKGKNQRLDVSMGQNYRVAVIFAPGPSVPPRPSFICFEPMAAITNALNLAQKGMYKELQSIPAGGAWEESFWVRATGF